MDHYLETIGLFYDEKVKFLSNKDNFIKCNGCPEMKEFKENIVLGKLLFLLQY